MLIRILAGTVRVALGLLMVWLCKRFIDTTIHTGTQEDIILMIGLLVIVIVAGIICRQIYYYIGVKVSAIQSTSIRLRIFGHLFRRQMFEQKELHSGDVTSRLEKDIDTECGERGGGLSEGQSQRIAIARGLLRPGNILLLDEISSSLDEHTERELYRQLFEAYPNKTMIFITHRPVVCELCDEVLSISA